jgi:hypothetical protein
MCAETSVISTAESKTRMPQSDGPAPVSGKHLTRMVKDPSSARRYHVGLRGLRRAPRVRSRTRTSYQEY